MAAYDTFCETDACRAPGFPQVAVSLSDLSLSVRVLDLSLDGGAPVLTLERTWTQDGARSAFGDRWAFNLDEALVAGDDSSFTLRRASGKVDRFAVAASSNTFFAVTATTDSLTRNADGSFTLASVLGSVRTFNVSGKLLSIKEGGAIVATFDYDNGGRLTVARSRGRSFRFDYDGSGRVTAVTDSAGRSAAFAYSGEGRLTTQTNADGSTVSYRYNDDGLLASVSRAGGALSIAWRYDESYVSVSSITLPDGATRQYDTPRSANEVRVVRGDGVSLYTSNALGLLDSYTDSAGNRTAYTYGAGGVRTRVVNGENESTRFEYDAAGNLTALVDGSGNRWTAAYRDGRIQGIVSPTGPVWEFGYENGGLTAVAPPAGASAAAVRNATGAVTRLDRFGVSSSYQYNSDGLVRQYTDPAGLAWTYEYDGAGRVSSRTDPAGNTLRAEYGAGLRPNAYVSGRTRVAVDENGVERDALGRVSKYNDGFGNLISYLWNSAGRLARINLPGDRSVSYEYDRDGQLTKVSDSAGNFAVYRYDAAGFPVSLNVSGGPVTIYQYDESRRLRAVVSTGPDGAAVAGYRYTMDGNANRTAIASLEPYTKTFRFADTAYGYNAAGQPVSRGGASYRYNTRGALAAIEGGPNLGFGYDDFGRLESVSGDASLGFAYDGQGLRTARTGGPGTRRYVYDLSGPRPRVIMETDGNGNLVAWYVHGSTLLWKVAANGRAYFYHFDGDGNTVALTNPSAGVVNRYRYDALGRMVANEEGVDNPFRARGASGAVDDGNGILYLDGQYWLPEYRATLPGSIDLRPPAADLTPPLPPPGMCLLRGIAECALAGARRLQ